MKKRIVVWAVIGADGRAWSHGWSEEEAKRDCDPGERVAKFVEADPLQARKDAVIRAAVKFVTSTDLASGGKDLRAIRSAVERLSKPRGKKR